MSLEVSDILINIRQFMMNEYNGFDQRLKEYQNNAEKKNAFVIQSKRAISERSIDFR